MWYRRSTLLPLALAAAPLLGLTANAPRTPAPQSKRERVGEIPLCKNTWKPRREEGNSHKLRVLLQAAALDVVPSGCRQGAAITGRAIHTGARPPRGRAPNSAICFPFRSDRPETDFIELLSNS